MNMCRKPALDPVYEDRVPCDRLCDYVVIGVFRELAFPSLPHRYPTCPEFVSRRSGLMPMSIYVTT